MTEPFSTIVVPFKPSSSCNTCRLIILFLSGLLQKALPGSLITKHPPTEPMSAPRQCYETDHSSHPSVLVQLGISHVCCEMSLPSQMAPASLSECLLRQTRERRR